VNAQTQGGRFAAISPAARFAGLALVLVPLLVRAMSILSLLPGWDIDPLVMSMTFTGVGPAESITLDCIAMLGAAILGAFAPRQLARADWIVVGLLAVGGASVLMHTGGGLGDLRIGASWLSAMLGASALWLCRRDESVRRVAGAVLVGFATVLALKGGQQILIEHPAMVAAYRADPASFLAGQGFLPDTPMARSFERRLLQSEATGWFGLSNVYATLMAGAGVSLVGILSLGVKRRAALKSRHLFIFAVAAIAALAALVATGSKGGALAAAAGGAALLLAAVLTKMVRKWPSVYHGQDARDTLGMMFGLATVIGPILLIVVRGLIGERLGELSLLFRWFYMQGAARIFAWHPMGVGPDGFQQTYLLAKPPISPEEVTSPHSIMFDWIADLGVFGIGWIVLLLLAAATVGRVLASSIPSHPVAPAKNPADLAIPSARSETRMILLIPGIATLLAAWLERGAVTPDGALVRLLGLIAWCGAAWGVLAIMRAVPAWPIALAAGAAAMLAHCQIDVAASWPQSVGIVAMWVSIASAAVPHLHGVAGPGPRAALSTMYLPRPSFALAGMALASIAIALPFPAWRWQRGLIEAREVLADVADLNQRFATIAKGASGTWPTALAAEVVAALKQRLPQHTAVAPRTGEELRVAMATLETIDLDIAARRLIAVAAAYPDEWRVRREASRLYLRAASAAAAAEDPRLAQRHLLNSAEAMDLPDPLHPNPRVRATAPQWRWLAIVHIERAKTMAEPDRSEDALGRASASLAHAAALDPYNLEIALRLMRVYGQLGDAPNARRWSAKALELDPLMRLDRTARGLTDAERSEVEAAARTP